MKKINKLISPLILAGSFSLGSPENLINENSKSHAQAYSQGYEYRNQDLKEIEELRGYGNAFRSLGYLWDSGILPADSFDDLRFYRGMSLFQHFMADYSYSQADNLEFRVLRDEIRRNRNLSPQEDAINQLYSHYGSGDITVETYIPQEKKWDGYDKEDIVWANHSGCGYHEVLLIKENEKWKVKAIGDYYNSRE